MITKVRSFWGLKKEILILALIFGSLISTYSQTISIKGNEFYVDSKRIWLNGVNTPWNVWNDFGGKFESNWWNNHFQTLKNNGINSSRIWISCDGNGAIKTDSTGVTGLSATFFKDCDSLFAIAKRNGIYIDATMMSFDHCKDKNPNYQNWRNIITNQDASQTFIDIYLIPFVNRYKSNPYLFAIDLCNEPEWISENKEDGQLPVADLQRFFGMCASAIHNHSALPVTIGSGCIKWNCDKPGFVGNYWKDSALQAAFNDPKAYLDFYCIHYYGWVHKYFKSPFELSPIDYGIEDKPVVIEESPAKDEGLKDIPITLIEAYEMALKKGYQGNMPWTSNGVDRNGNITTVGPATLSFKNNHPELVFPLMYGKVSDNCVTNTILSGYSEKAYTTVPVTDQQLDLILKCGIKAPSGRNIQPWKFTVIKDEATMKEIINDVVPGNVLVIVSGIESESGTTPDFDCGLATENMTVAAHSVGLGARIYASPAGNINSKKDLFQIPTGYKVVVVLRIGNIDKSVDAVSAATPRKKFEEVVNYKKQ